MVKKLKKSVLIIVDMQNDFIDGTLANPAAQEIVDKICKMIEKKKSSFESVIFTRDTHSESYLDSMEGKKLPIKHCVRDTPGWCVNTKIYETVRDSGIPFCFIDKPTFGYTMWGSSCYLKRTDTITMVGTCTDICVISNALLLKAACPDTEIKVIGSLCAGLTPEKHEAALEVMRSCQIEVIE